MEFTPGHIPPRDRRETDLWFVLQDGKLLVKPTDTAVSIPVARDLAELNIRGVDDVYLGKLGGADCYAVDLPGTLTWPDNLFAREFRPVLDELSAEHVAVALRAAHVVHWRRVHRRCGRCGALLVDWDQERARKCMKCGLVFFPRISPAIIVAVVRDGRILLASESRFSSGLHGVLAGFVEPGETLEDCVRREIFEEVGIEVTDVKYFGSQPWPFPDSLMIAFTAEYAGGEIAIDKREILRAGWFAPEDLPRIPSRVSIARALIDWFAKTYGQRSCKEDRIT